MNLVNKPGNKHYVTCVPSWLQLAVIVFRSSHPVPPTCGSHWA